MKGDFFDLSMLSAFKPFLTRERLLFAAFAPLSLLPVYLFDRIDVPILLFLLLAIPALAKLLTPRYWAHVALCPALALLALAGGEAFIRVSWFGLSGLNFSKYAPVDPSHPISGASMDWASTTGFKPGSEYFLWGQPFHVNSDGFRGKTYPVAKPAEGFRIVIIGASFSEGVGVSEEDRVSDVLEKLLNERRPIDRRFEVINLSLVGNTLGNLAYYLRETGLKYSPDLILCEIGAQTLGIFSDSTIQPNPGRFKEPEHKSLLFPGNPYLDASYHFFINEFFLARALVAAKGHPVQTGLATDQTVLKGFRQIREIAGGRPLVFYHLRTISSDMADTGHQMGFRKMTRRLTRALGIPVIDTTYATYPNLPPRKLIVYPGDQHPNATVHRIYAEVLYENLLPYIHGQVRQ